MTHHGRFHYTPPAPPRPEDIAVNTARGHEPRRQLSSDTQRRSIVALWSCPVCDAAVPRLRGPGRHRVYCTNSCKQKAYRHRCRQRQSVPMSIRRDPRPTRATTLDRVHAVREFADLSSGRRDSTRRGITTCGAFARIALDTPERFGHLRFVGREALHGTTCQRCVVLTGAETSTADVEWRQAA